MAAGIDVLDAAMGVRIEPFDHAGIALSQPAMNRPCLENFAFGVKNDDLAGRVTCFAEQVRDCIRYTLIRARRAAMMWFGAGDRSRRSRPSSSSGPGRAAAAPACPKSRHAACGSALPASSPGCCHISAKCPATAQACHRHTWPPRPRFTTSLAASTDVAHSWTTSTPRLVARPEWYYGRSSRSF